MITGWSASGGITKLQSIAERAIRSWFPDKQVLRNFRPVWLKGVEVDIFVPDCRLAVEVDGIQHRYWCPEIHPTLDDYMKQKRHDIRKKWLCLKNRIMLVRIGSSRKAFIRFCNKMSSLYPELQKNDALDQEWQEHVDHLISFYKDKPRILSLSDGSLTPMNEAGKRFLFEHPRAGFNAQSVSTTADNGAVGSRLVLLQPRTGG